MFRLQDPPVIVTQQEHARLAGVVAAHWGNEAFDAPRLPRASFVAGVTLHDWHYGQLDEFPLDDLTPGMDGEQRANAWLDLAQRASAITLDDAIAEGVAKRHHLRLIGDDRGERADAIRQRIEACLTHLCSEAGISRPTLDRDDRITAVCDRVAFDLFRSPRSGPIGAVPACGEDGDDIAIHCEVETGRAIRLDPWPLGVAALVVPMVVFQRKGYPDTLRPGVVEVRIEPMDPRKG